MGSKQVTQYSFVTLQQRFAFIRLGASNMLGCRNYHGQQAGRILKRFPMYVLCEVEPW
jgi:hypothetical protein